MVFKEPRLISMQGNVVEVKGNKHDDVQLMSMVNFGIYDLSYHLLIFQLYFHSYWNYGM